MSRNITQQAQCIDRAVGKKYDKRKPPLGKRNDKNSLVISITIFLKILNMVIVCFYNK